MFSVISLVGMSSSREQKVARKTPVSDTIELDPSELKAKSSKDKSDLRDLSWNMKLVSYRNPAVLQSSADEVSCQTIQAQLLTEPLRQALRDLLKPETVGAQTGQKPPGTFKPRIFPVKFDNFWRRLSHPDDHPLGAPSLERVYKTKAQRLRIANELSEWMEKKLAQEDAIAAVVARSGRWLTKAQDRTGMEHAGIAVFDEKEKKWEIYNLLNGMYDKRVKCGIFRNTPVDFFYSQPQKDRDALILIPDKATQKKLVETLSSRESRQLMFTSDYNLVTRFDSPRSLNCNKWVLMNLMAARLNDYEPMRLLKAIHEKFQPARLKIWPVIRPILKKHHTVMKEEAPLTGPIHSVTVESLFRSDFFDKAFFFKEKPSLLKSATDSTTSLSVTG